MAKQKYNPLLKIGFQEVSNGGGGGGGDLQSTLIAGNITGSNSIIFSTGATIKPSAGNFCIDPQFFGIPDLSVISNITTTDTVGVFTITGTSGSIDTLTVNGNPLISSAVSFNGNISQTALDLINQMIGDAGGLGITYPRPPRIVSVDFNSNTAKILVVLDGTYNTNVLASTTTTLVFAQVQPMTLQNIYDGSLIIDSTTNQKYASLIVNPFESFGYQQKDSDIIRIGVTDSGGPQSFVSIVPNGVFIYNETNITDLTTDISELVGLGLVSTVVDRIVNNTTSTSLIAICLNSGNNSAPSNINQGVVGAVLLSGIGLTAKTNHTPYTNQISFQESGNTFDTLLVAPTATSDNQIDLPDASGTVALEKETFYLERIETIDESSTTPKEYFTFVQGGTEISNLVNAIGGTYNMEISLLAANTSAGGSVVINPQIGATNVFSQPYTKQPNVTQDIFYININKRVTLAAGVNAINLQLSNIGGGNGRIFEANITLTKI